MLVDTGIYRVALTEATAEIVRAKDIHPDDFHSMHEAYAVLLEEVDELWDVVKLNPKHVDASDEPGPRTCTNYRAEYQELQRKVHRRMLRAEAIQVAAMAIRFAAELT